MDEREMSMEETREVWTERNALIGEVLHWAHSNRFTLAGDRFPRVISSLDSWKVDALTRVNIPMRWLKGQEMLSELLHSLDFDREEDLRHSHYQYLIEDHVLAWDGGNFVWVIRKRQLRVDPN